MEATEVKNETFRLVTKIISWKTKSQDSLYWQNQDKITDEEWQRYRDHLLNISKTDSVDKVKEKLNDIFSAIQNNQGFK